uniref:Uncharacterized protein n=1 Tax=Arundo donax TaxID=35708 RepID=A0A0A9QUL7_ARUDO
MEPDGDDDDAYTWERHIKNLSGEQALGVGHPFHHKNCLLRVAELLHDAGNGAPGRHDVGVVHDRLSPRGRSCRARGSSAAPSRGDAGDKRKARVLRFGSRVLLVHRLGAVLLLPCRLPNFGGGAVSFAVPFHGSGVQLGALFRFLEWNCLSVIGEFALLFPFLFFSFFFWLFRFCSFPSRRGRRCRASQLGAVFLELG